MTREIGIVPLGGLGEIGLNCLALEYEERLLVIDADTHWIGELSHSSFPLTSFNCREVVRSMTAALRIAQTLGELGLEALKLRTSEPVPVRVVHAAAQLNQTLDNPSTAPTRPRL